MSDQHSLDLTCMIPIFLGLLIAIGGYWLLARVTFDLLSRVDRQNDVPE